MTPAAIIREARIRAGLTQSALAAQLGVTVGTVARWEGGTRDPAASALLETVAVCGFILNLRPER